MDLSEIKSLEQASEQGGVSVTVRVSIGGEIKTITGCAVYEFTANTDEEPVIEHIELTSFFTTSPEHCISADAMAFGGPDEFTGERKAVYEAVVNRLYRIEIDAWEAARSEWEPDSEHYRDCLPI